MKRNVLKECDTSAIMLMGMIWLLAFQNPLELVWKPFSYIDECVALIGALAGTYEIIIRQKCRISKELLWIGIPMLVFVVAGLTGNMLYRYQPLKCVVIDLYTNLKFFFAIGTGYYLFRKSNWDKLKKTANLNVKLIVIILFCVFLVDRVFNFYPSEIRYGLKSAKLFYSHPTYLAGAVTFLLVVLTVFFKKKNIPFIIISLVMVTFTLRSKAIASVLVYITLFVFYIVLKKTLKWWHVVLGGVLCAAVAWPQINFYFIKLAGGSARSVMLLTSLVIMKEYFPIGTGFGTYASAEAAKHYSPVYLKYGFNDNFELRDLNNVDNSLRLIHENEWLTQYYQAKPELVYKGAFYSDQFWPIIFGQTGVIGTLAFLLMLYRIIKRCFELQKYDLYAYVGVLFVFVYLFVSSTAEPAFSNAVAIPLALITGIVYAFLSLKRMQAVCVK